MPTTASTPRERARDLLRRGSRSIRRRVSEHTTLVDAPEIDHQRRNDAFGPARRLGVLHIPKSAGSSVSTALRSALDDRSWSPYDFDPALFGPFRDRPVPVGEAPRVLPDPRRLGDVDAASGHFALPTMLAGFDRADLVMLLREPRSRLLSHYEYWRGLPADLRADDRTWSVTAHARELDFDDWLQDTRSAYQSDNIVLRTLMAGHKAVPDDDFIDPADVGELTDLALHRLASIGWVDVVERGPAMWDGLEARIGRPLKRPRVNATERRADLPTRVASVVSDAAVESLHRRTAADRALWVATAQRRNVADVELEADRAWFSRLREVLDATSPPTPAR